MTLSDGIRNFSAYFRMFVERFINFFLFSIVTFQKSVITTVKGYKVISPGKEGTEPMADLELLSIGLINDMYCESRNDSFSYAVLADQAAMDAF